MHALRLLQKIISSACPNIHKNRLHALIRITEALLYSQRLSLTQLGRNLVGKAYVKHKIKRVDRLLGNSHLATERRWIYEALAHRLLKNVSQPVIIVDWSELTNDQAYQLLRASLPLSGRSITLFEEAHPISKLTNRLVHKRFLNTLKEMLPDNCHPIIVTDAGFRTTWFKMVEKLGWDYVGRVRNRTMLKADDETHWRACKTLYAIATSRARYLGQYEQNRSNPLPGYFYIIKNKRKGRKRRTQNGTLDNSKNSKKVAKGQREPWLLVTSLGGHRQLAKRVVNLYRTRMQIEEGFRDTKSYRLGFSLSESLTRNAGRLEILLLISVLANWVLWVLGTLGEQQLLHYRYQSNTKKKGRALSVLYLGRQLVKQKVCDLRSKQFNQILDSFRGDFDYECFE
jgi:hypothetical protein